MPRVLISSPFTAHLRDPHHNFVSHWLEFAAGEHVVRPWEATQLVHQAPHLVAIVPEPPAAAPPALVRPTAAQVEGAFHALMTGLVQPAAPAGPGAALPAPPAADTNTQPTHVGLEPPKSHAATAFNWTPYYEAITQQRLERLIKLREAPDLLPDLFAYYREHPVDFIEHWGWTHDPRNAQGLRAVPFVPWKRQRELLEWMLDRWGKGEPGLVEKSRDSGVSWLCVALACTLCLFNRGLVIGFGSRKEQLVDNLGDPSSLFAKARMFLDALPREFQGSWDRSKHASYMRITFPDTGSVIAGEAGPNIGRGARASLYFVDEAAHLEHPAMVDAALSGTTNCRIDVSTPCGMGNPFAVKRFSGKVPVFTFHWRDDPRKDDAWYAQQRAQLDPRTLAQEISLDYAASVEGVLIPAAWVQSAVDAHRKLGIEPSGARLAGLDVADEGRDKNAFAGRYGILLETLESWSGKDSDILRTTARALAICDAGRYEVLYYDADGLGAGVRGDAAELTRQRQAESKATVAVSAFRGSGSVHNPDGSMVKGRVNKDYFANLKAQSWWALRLRFERTYRAVVDRLPFDPDEIISLSPELPELPALLSELSQPTYSVSNVGKILVDKAPEGAMSPNLADAAMIAYSPFTSRLEVWRKL